MRTMSTALAALFLAACSSGDSTSAMAGGGKACCQAGEKKADACCKGDDKKACCLKQVVDKKFLKPAEGRTFEVEYVGKVAEIPAGTKKLRVWMPVPETTSVQEIRNLTFSKEAKLATEPKYGNKIAYVEIENPGATAE